jgi:tRNA U34 5-methylaminomethyl-2-thiouridine-forming methyltransferase MnmC
LHKIILTSDGSHTIYNSDLDEYYHSIHGAVQESTFIFINNGFDICQADPLNIFEVGFGTGLNVLLTAMKSYNDKRVINYSAIDKNPLPEKVTKSLNYSHFTDQVSNDIYSTIHSSPWDININICNNFYLKKIKGDVTTKPIEGIFDLIYFDAFGPDKQPEMWTKEIFEIIGKITNQNGILVTYSAKGEVKRNLKACGFNVTRQPGPPGKRHITRAIKI